MLSVPPMPGRIRRTRGELGVQAPGAGVVSLPRRLDKRRGVGVDALQISPPQRNSNHKMRKLQKRARVRKGHSSRILQACRAHGASGNPTYQRRDVARRAPRLHCQIRMRPSTPLRAHGVTWYSPAMGYHFLRIHQSTRRPTQCGDDDAANLLRFRDSV